MFFINDMSKNAIFEFSESWLIPNDKMFPWYVAPKTLTLFRCDRKSTNCKKKGGGVMVFVPCKQAPSERDESSVFDNFSYESLWVQCRCNFSKTASLNYS